MSIAKYDIFIVIQLRELWKYRSNISNKRHTILIEIISVKLSKTAKWITISNCGNVVKGACYIRGKHKDYTAIKEDPPNDNEVNVYVVFEVLRLVEKDEIKQTLTAQLKMKMYWSEPRLRNNFSHENEIDTIYDHLNIRYPMPLLGQDIRTRINIWLPDYDFDRQLMVAHVSGNSVITSLKLIRNAYGEHSSNIEMG